MLSRSAAQGLNPFNTRYDNNRFGGQVGGPIIKNKLFFFTNWEYNPLGSSISSTACAPTAAGYAMLAANPNVNAINLQQFQKYVPAASAAASASDSNCSRRPRSIPLREPGLCQFRPEPVGFSGAYYNNILTTVNSVGLEYLRQGPSPCSL